MLPPVQKTDPWVGRTIHERYEVLRPVARGSMGSVYVARHTALDREVAVKILDVQSARHVQDSQSDSRDRKRFLREASMLAKLTHPNTVRVFDFGLEQETPFIVMEFVNGQTLQELLASTKTLQPERAMRIARQVCGSLGEAHDLGLVHRDLKPANILVTTDFDGSDLVKVVDFGLVKEVRDAVQMTGDGVMIGTPMYMSPEQIRGRTLDQRCDIYALGVILYKMLLGRPPFVESQTAALLVAHITDPVPAFTVVNPSLEFPVSVEFTVRKCLEKEPEDRFDTTRDLLRALKVCEAAILDAGLAESAQWELMDGRRTLPPELDSIHTDVVDQRMVARVRRRRLVSRVQWVLATTFAMLLASAFGYVGVRAVLSMFEPEVATSAPSPVEPQVPVPVPLPALPPPPAPSAEVAEAPTEEAVAPAAAPVTEPEPLPAPRSQPRPRSRSSRPRPAPAAPAEPVAEPAPPEPPKPPPQPSPAPTPGLGPSSDLTDPWSSNGDNP